MTTLAQYEAAIQRAEADDNPEAAAELRARRDSEWSEGYDMSRYESNSPEQLKAAAEKAREDDNEEAYQELMLVRGVKLAEADDNPEAAKELLRRLGPSDMRNDAMTNLDGIDNSGEIPVVVDLERNTQYHQALEDERLAQEAREAQWAQDEEDFSNQPFATKALAVAGDAASIATDLPKTAIDMVGRIFGAESGEWTSALGIPRGAQSTPAGSWARAGSEMLGNTMAVGGGFAPVKRSADEASSVVADIMGFGNSVGDDSAKLASRSVAAQQQMPETSRVMPNVLRTQIDLRNGDMVQEIAQEVSDETVMMVNSRGMAALDQAEFDYQDTMADIADRVSKGTIRGDMLKAERKAAEVKKAEDIKKADADARKTEQGDLGGVTVFGEKFEESVVKHMARRFELPEQDVQLAIVRAGGLRRVDETGNYMNDSLSNVRQRRYDAVKEEMYTPQGAPKSKNVMDKLENSKVARWIRPATAHLRENVGKGFAAKVEQAYMGATRNKTAMTLKYQARQANFKQMVDWAEQSHIKRQFMDLRFTGVEGRAKLIAEARKGLDRESAEMFNEYLDDAYRHQKGLKDNIFSAEAVLDDIYWNIAKIPGIEETAEETTRRMGKNQIARGAEPTTISQTAQRERGRASSMSQDELDSYDNPIMSQFSAMGNDQDVLQLFQKLGMGGTLKEVADLGDVTGAIVRHVRAVTGSDEKAAAAGKIMESIIQGSRKTPPQGMRIFMSQAYAGTLGQVDSAMLNAHDMFTSAWRQGPVATGRAVADFLDSNRITADEFGIGDAHVGEFREGVHHAFTGRRTKTDWLEQKVNGYSDFAFTWSGFKAMDLAGKGVIMRATLYDMQDLAGREGGMKLLRKKYGHLMSDRELGEVARFLKAGTDIRKATPRQLDILGNAMLGRVAEQQLLSMASRPLAYLDNPQWRPVFAMSGFAIRQADILKVEVLDRVADSDYVGAGIAAAGWLGWSVTGYVITDTVRDSVTYGLEKLAGGEGSDSKDPRQIGHRFYEGVAGPLTMNKLGDVYSTESFLKNPGDYALTSLLPPSGVVGSGAKAVTDTGMLIYKELTDQDHNINPLHNLYEALPSIGRQLKYVAEAAAEDDKGRGSRRSGGTSRNSKRTTDSR